MTTIEATPLRLRPAEYSGAGPSTTAIETSLPSRTSQIASRAAEPALERRRRWESRYRRRLRVTDTVVVFVVVGAAAMADVATHLSVAQHLWPTLRVPVLAAAIWIAMLAVFGTRSPVISGAGPAEYKRVAHATGMAFGVMAMVFVAFEWRGVRMQLLVALPLGFVLLLLDRWTWRRWLITERIKGHYTSQTLITGTRTDIAYVVRHLQRDTNHAHVVIGAATLDDTPDDVLVDDTRIPVVGSGHTVAEQARLLGADSVIVASRPRNDPDFVKRLGWDLEGTAADLILSSSVADVAGPRISLDPVDGLPLINVRIPEFDGGRHTLKRALDILLSVVALIPIAVLAAPIALLIKADDRGPVFFRQTRVGQYGEKFGILKFRTMRTDAEERLAQLQAADEGAGLLFKMKDDPRITRVGAFLRKYSFDELPQFWNVLRGDMSIVGPRPPLPTEVAQYDGMVSRRLLTKPGITGLWQVSGRSDLSWDESVRLDLRYVENWSVVTDLMIMWRTVKVIVHPSGAY